MERIFYSILVGGLIGIAAANWLPPHRLEVVAEFWQTMQARAQTPTTGTLPRRPQTEEGELTGAPSAPVNSTRPKSWPGGQARPLPPPPMPAADGSISLVSYFDDAGPNAPPAAPAAGAPAPFPRTMPPTGGPPAGPPAAAPPMPAAGAAGPPATGPNAPGFRFPRGEERTSQGVEISYLEGTQILARVGTEVIMANELLPTIDQMLAPYKGKYPEQALRNQRMLMVQQFLPQLIETKAIVMEAKRKIPKEGWSGVQKQIDQEFETREIPRMLKRLECGTKAELIAKLDQYGSSLEVERRAFGDKIMRQQWIQQSIRHDEEITYEEMLKFYRDHLEDFEIVAQSRWEEVMVRFDRFPNKGAAFREIARLGNLILDGAPFADVARTSSHGLTAKDGGARDWTRRGSLTAEALDKAIFSLPVNSLSAVIETEQGFCIVRVVERQEAGRTPFEDAQSVIRQRIKQEREQEQINEFLAKITEKTKVWTIFDNPEEAQQLGRVRPPGELQR